MFGLCSFRFWLAIVIAPLLAFAQVPRQSSHPSEAISSLTVPFEKNIGQRDPGAEYYATGAGFSVTVKRDGMILDSQAMKRVEVKLVGASSRVLFEGEGAAGTANMFFGSDPEQWVSKIPTYTQLREPNVYPGIDLIYHARLNGLIKTDFIVGPGADPSKIRMTVEGPRKIRLDGGDLVMLTADGELRQQKPRSYQTIDGLEREIESAYEIRNGVISIRLGAYDTSRVLVIDPVLSYSTVFGGSGFDSSHSIALDSAGNIYLAGETTSAGLPAKSALQSNMRGLKDAFVLKLNPSGTAIIYSTFLGGGQDDSALGIALDPSGNLYVTGVTQSPDFPVTAGAYQTAFRGQSKAFVAKLSAAGQLIYASYLGGGDSDSATAIAVDASGAAYVTGYTSSTDFPTTAGAFQSTYKGGYADVFVTRFSPSGTNVTYSTLIGGTANDTAQSIALDPSGNCYVAGQTNSTDFPVINAAQPSNSGGGDAFVLKLDPSGHSLIYSTFLGGSGVDTASGIALDTAGNAYVVGATASWDFPVTTGAVQTANAGLYDVFATKISPSGTSVVYSTYIGGSGSEQATAIGVDGQGQAWITGFTNSINFPVQNALQRTWGGSFDAFLLQLSPSGTTLIYSSYIGGTGDDRTTGMAVDNRGSAYLTGLTSSSDFITTTGALQSRLVGGYDAFIMKFTFAQPPVSQSPVAVSVTPNSGNGVAQQFTFVWSDANGSSDIAGIAVLFNTSINAQSACLVLVDPIHRNFLLADDSGSNFSVLSVGATSSLQNSQCVLNGSSSTLTASGNNLTLVAAVSFKTAFAGSKTSYMWVQNNAGGASWQTMGSWTIPGNSPAALGVVKTHVGNFTQGQRNGTYTVVVSNAIGAGATSGVVTVTETTPPGLTLVSLSGTGWNCTGNACTRGDSLTGGASYSPITVTVNVAANATSPQVNQVNVSGGGSPGATATDSTTIGTTSAGPVAVSVAPSSGTATMQQFTFIWSDTNGFSDVNGVAVLFNNGIDVRGACFFLVDPVNRSFLFADDSGSSFSALGIGAPGSLQNSQCVLNGNSSTLIGSGNSLTLTVNISFKTAFAGTKSTFMWVKNNAGVTNNWQSEGSWTVPGATPSLSITKSHTGTFTQGQQNATYIVTVSNAIGSSATSGTVTVTETVPAGLTLASMAGNGWSCSSSTCNRSDSLAGGASYPAITIAVNVASNATSPQVNNVSVSGGGSPAATASDSTVIGSVNSAPTAVSVTPSSGTGTTQQFTFVWTDSGGFTDITGVAVLFNTKIDGQSACLFLVDPVHRNFLFADDSGSNFSVLAVGTAGTLQNSQCALYGSGSTLAGTGNNLMLTVTLNFKPAFAGSKSTFQWIQSAAGTANWQNMGSWIVP